MCIADLKTRLHDAPGIETLTMTMLADRQNYNLTAGDCAGCRRVGLRS